MKDSIFKPAITVAQPWASLMVLGVKKVEVVNVILIQQFADQFQSQTLYIHTAGTVYSAYLQYVKNEEFRLYCNDAYEKLHGCRPKQTNPDPTNPSGYIMSWKYFESAWPTKAIIGCVNLHKVCPVSELKKEWTAACKLTDLERETVLNDFNSGVSPVALVCRDAQRFNKPIRSGVSKPARHVWNAAAYI